MGNESQNPTRDARNPQRASRAASSGIGVPCSAYARVHAINRFCTRHTTPHVFSSIRNPIPPPTLIAKCEFDDIGLEFNSSTTHDAAITIAVIATARTHGL